MGRIEASAIQFQIPNSSFWHTLTAKRHADIYELLFRYQIPYNPQTLIEGFVTSNNQFIDRRDAVYEAIDASQLPIDFDGRFLYSEDLWPEEDEE